MGPPWGEIWLGNFALQNKKMKQDTGLFLLDISVLWKWSFSLNRILTVGASRPPRMTAAFPRVQTDKHESPGKCSLGLKPHWFIEFSPANLNTYRDYTWGTLEDGASTAYFLGAGRNLFWGLIPGAGVNTMRLG